MLTGLRSVLVTGANGFIGTSLVRRLSAEGIQVCCLVRTGSSGSAGLRALPNVSVIQIDNYEPEGLAKSLQAVDIDIVYNLASAGVDPAERDPLAMLHGNLNVIAGLIRGLAERSPRALLHVGSCSEYAAAPSGHKLQEEDLARPASLYGAAKLCAHLYGSVMAADQGIPFLCLRLFGVFGVGEAHHRLVPYLIQHLRENRPVDLTSGEQVRDLLYIDDVVEALLAAAALAPPAPMAVYNVCSGEGARVREIAELTAELMAKPQTLLRFGERPYRSDEALWVVGDNRRFTSATGWLPKVTLSEGIHRMVAEAR